MIDEEKMVERYGEVCNKRTAGRILSRSASCINAMLKDGRLDEACAGTMVSVRSIARYISAPRLEENKARIRRIKEKNGSNWAV